MAEQMGRAKVSQAKINRVTALSRRTTIRKACAKVKIAPSTFFRHRAQQPERFLAISLNWQKLGESYRPSGISKLNKAERRLLAREVVGALRSTFDRPAHLKTAKQKAAAIRRVAKTLERSVEAYRDLSTDIIQELDELVDAGNASMGDPERAIRWLAIYATSLQEAASQLEESHGMRSHDRGGPASDPRVREAVVRLADIYVKYQKAVPTHTTSPATGVSKSSFDSFVQGAFGHFLYRAYPELFGAKKRPGRAIRSAMQHTAARIDWTDDVRK